MREQDLIGQIQAMPDDELRDVRRDLTTGIGLMRRDSPMHAPATAYLTAIIAEVDRRARQHARPLLACLVCQMISPPPEQTCTLGRDHYVGRASGCPACGRLIAACVRRPCSAFMT